MWRTTSGVIRHPPHVRPANFSDDISFLSLTVVCIGPAFVSTKPPVYLIRKEFLKLSQSLSWNETALVLSRLSLPQDHYLRHCPSVRYSPPSHLFAYEIPAQILSPFGIVVSAFDLYSVVDGRSLKRHVPLLCHVVRDTSTSWSKRETCRFPNYLASRLLEAFGGNIAHQRRSAHAVEYAPRKRTSLCLTT